MQLKECKNFPKTHILSEPFSTISNFILELPSGLCNIIWREKKHLKVITLINFNVSDEKYNDFILDIQIKRDKYGVLYIMRSFKVSVLYLNYTY